MSINDVKTLRSPLPQFPGSLLRRNPETNSDISIGSHFLTYGGSLSAVLLHLTVVHLYKTYRLASDRLPVHRQFAATIIITQFFVICMVIFSKNDDESRYVCYFMAVILHYGIMSMFVWMLVESINMAAKLLIVFDTHHFYSKYLVLGWGCPLVIILLVSASYGEGYRSHRICWVSKPVFVSSIIPTVTIVIMANASILGSVLYIIRKSDPTVRYLSTAKKFLNAAALLLPALVLTLTLTVLGAAVDEAGHVFPYFTFAFFFSSSFLATLLYAFHSVLVTDGRLTILYMLVLALRTPEPSQVQPPSTESEQLTENIVTTVTTVKSPVTLEIFDSLETSL